MTINEALMYGLVSNLDMLSLPENKFHKVYMAKEILRNAAEKQIPMKPPNHDITVCPACNSKAKYGHPYELYCCHCGQRIEKTEF